MSIHRRQRTRTTSAAGTPARPRETAPHAATYRGLVDRGLAPEEAANVVAVIAGIPIVDQPWKLREVTQLRFLRWIRDQGGFGPNDGP